MSHTWITSTFQYGRQHKIGLPPCCPKMEPLRKGDDLIMLALLSSHAYTPPQMKALNTCRMELKVFWLSKISLSDGQRINPLELQPLSRGESLSHNQYLWPTQSHTTSSDWTLWRQALQFLCSTDRYNLPIKMTTWTLPQSNYITDWEWFCSHDYSHLWQHQSGGWY